MKRAFRIPLVTPFREMTFRTGWVVQGEHGWGECSPWPGGDVRAAAAAARAIASAPFPQPVRASVPVNVTVPAIAPADAADLVARSGCTTAKVKVAEGDDEPRVEAVRDALGPHGRLRVDANGRWDVAEAVRNIRALARYDLEFVEQPATTIEELVRIRKKVDVPIAADESVCSVEDAVQVVDSGAADVLICKVQQIGGVDAGLRIADACGDVPIVVSSLVETSIGISAGVALAAALPNLPYACGLGTLSLLEGDITDDPMHPVDGELSVRRPVIDEAALVRYEVTEGEP